MPRASAIPVGAITWIFRLPSPAVLLEGVILRQINRAPLVFRLLFRFDGGLAAELLHLVSLSNLFRLPVPLDNGHFMLLLLVHAHKYVHA